MKFPFPTTPFISTSFTYFELVIEVSEKYRKRDFFKNAICLEIRFWLYRFSKCIRNLLIHYEKDPIFVNVSMF